MSPKLSELWHSEEQKTPKTVAVELKWDLRGWRDHRICHNIFRASQIWDSYHVKFTFALASWTQRWDCWTFHTQPFTHMVLCSVKLPSDVALSEQWLSEQSPWGLSHLCKQEHPGGDICCLVWILMNAHSAPRLHTAPFTSAHHNMIRELIQSVSAKARCHLPVWSSGKDVKEVCIKGRTCSHVARLTIESCFSFF